MEATAILESYKFKGFRQPVSIGEILTVRLGDERSIDGRLQENAELRVIGFDWEWFPGAEEPCIIGIIVKNDDSLRYPVGQEITFSKYDICD
jgi:hypothetical protein